MLRKKPKTFPEIFGQFLELFEEDKREAIMEFVHDGVMVAKDCVAAGAKPVVIEPDDIPDMRRR